MNAPATHPAEAVEAVRQMTNKDMVLAIVDLQKKVAELSAKLETVTVVRNAADREMTEADALSILNGDCKDMKHKDAALKLGLSYGQVYSCRLEHTFKGVLKTLKASGWKNTWVK